MKRQFLQTSCILTLFVLLFVLPTTAHATETEESVRL